jgi:hypothetical protein
MGAPFEVELALQTVDAGEEASRPALLLDDENVTRA